MATIDELHAQSVSGDIAGLKQALIKALRTGAEFVSPPANGPGAAAVAGIRSLLPGRGNFSQEFDRYNRAAAPSPLYSGPEKFGSVVKAPGQVGPSPGEASQAQAMALQTAMVAALKPGKATLQQAEQKAAEWQHLGNLAAERGNMELAERHYARSQPWRARMNELLEKGPVETPSPEAAAAKVLRGQLDEGKARDLVAWSLKGSDAPKELADAYIDRVMKEHYPALIKSGGDVDIWKKHLEVTRDASLFNPLESPLGTPPIKNWTWWARGDDAEGLFTPERLAKARADNPNPRAYKIDWADK